LLYIIINPFISTDHCQGAAAIPELIANAANKAKRKYLFIMLLFIDLTPYTTNMENKILKKQLYIMRYGCKDRVITLKRRITLGRINKAIRKNGSKTRNPYKNRLLYRN
jgi:hypothetical protein